MKKTLSLVVIALLVSVLFMGTVYATTSFTVALAASTTKVAQGGEVELTVSLKNFTAGETGINAIGFAIDYDKAVFETLATTDLTSLGGWSAPTFNPANGEFITENSSFMAENHDMLKIKFKVKASATAGNTVIAIKDIDGSDAVNDIYPSDQKITLTIQAENTTPVKNEVVNTPVNVTNEVKQEATKNPTTGFEDVTVPAIIAISALGLVAYARYRNLEK